jgi:transcriptional regulator with XRE-family HTH domain
MSKEKKSKEKKFENAALLKAIGEKIRTKREELKLSQGEIADILELSYTQIYHYETGRSEIPITNLLRLCEFFNVDIHYFISEIKNENQEKLSIVKYPENPELEKRIVAVKEIYKSENEDLIIGVNNCVDSMSIILKKRQEQRRDNGTVKKTRLGRTGKK